MLLQRLQAILTVGAIFILLTVCDSVDPSGPDAKDLHVSLVNDSRHQAVIFGQGEEFDPFLALAPTKSREMTIEEASKGNYRFNAYIFEEATGGQWVYVAGVRCYYDEEFRARIVSYRGGTALVCENW